MCNPHTSNPHHIYSTANPALPLCPHANHDMVTFICAKGSGGKSSSKHKASIRRAGGELEGRRGKARQGGRAGWRHRRWKLTRQDTASFP